MNENWVTLQYKQYIFDDYEISDVGNVRHKRFKQVLTNKSGLVRLYKSNYIILIEHALLQSFGILKYMYIKDKSKGINISNSTISEADIHINKLNAYKGKILLGDNIN